MTLKLSERRIAVAMPNALAVSFACLYHYNEAEPRILRGSGKKKCSSFFSWRPQSGAT